MLAQKTLMLTIDDFKTSSITCEVRHREAYMIYDRTGRIVESLRDSFTDVSVTSASPPQTDFRSNEGNFTILLGASRLTCPPNTKPESFAKYCADFFNTALDQLNVTVLTRIGLRHILRKESKTLDESKETLASMPLLNPKLTKRFNISRPPLEIMLKWEDGEIGAMVRLRAETAEFKVTTAPAELQEEVRTFEKKIHGLTLDVDYYTVAPVEREQWNPAEWVSEKLRIIRKEADGILQG